MTRECPGSFPAPTVLEPHFDRFGETDEEIGYHGAHRKHEGTPHGERAAMEAYKREFIEFMVQSDVLKFGDFTLKSGRKSPFFMNAGAYVTGEQLHRLGLYYAQAINDNFGLDFDVVFGPAYKGIPLAGGDGHGASGAVRQGGKVLLQPQGSEGPRRRRRATCSARSFTTATRSSWWRTSPLRASPSTRPTPS